jgi:hypothetical protein
MDKNAEYNVSWNSARITRKLREESNALATDLPWFDDEPSPPLYVCFQVQIYAIGLYLFRHRCPELELSIFQ